MQGLLGFETFLFKINICWKLCERYFGYPRHPSFLWPFRMRKTISSFRGSQVLLAEGGGGEYAMQELWGLQRPNDGATSCGVDIQALKKGYPNKKTPYLLMNMNIQVEVFWEHGCFHWFFSRSCETETHDFLRAFPQRKVIHHLGEMRWTTSGQVSIRNIESPWLVSLK